jgi:hypothetical protein
MSIGLVYGTHERHNPSMVHRRRWFVAALAIALVACSEDDAYDACSPEHIVDDAEGVSATPLRR